MNLGGLLIIRTLFNVAIAETAANDRMTAYSELETCGRKQFMVISWDLLEDQN